jgi:hypothetical protein
VFENRVLRRIFCPVSEEVAEGWRRSNFITSTYLLHGAGYYLKS